jgi:hypothetical protein
MDLVFRNGGREVIQVGTDAIEMTPATDELTAAIPDLEVVGAA